MRASGGWTGLPIDRQKWTEREKAAALDAAIEYADALPDAGEGGMGRRPGPSGDAKKCESRDYSMTGAKKDPTLPAWAPLPPAGEDWQSWTGFRGGRGRPGCSVSLAPSGGLTISRELTEQLDPKQPYMVLRYSLICKKLRLIPQREIVAGSLRWLPREGRCAHLSARAAMVHWGLLPSQVCIYAGTIVEHPEIADKSCIEVDLSAPIETLAARASAAQGGRLDLRRACPDCGKIVAWMRGREGRVRPRPHHAPDGERCGCGQAE